MKVVGETLPQARNKVTLADEKDQYGLPIARVSWSMSDNYQRQDEYAVTSCVVASTA